MAEKKIKTTLQLDGEKQFKEAIAASKQELKVMGSELRAAAAEYQLSGDKMDYLGKRTNILTREIAEQEKAIKQTADMLQKAAAGGEGYTSKVNRLKIELNNSEAALSRMKKELQDADREMEELGRDSLTTGREIERGLTDAAEDAAKEVRQMVSEMNTSVKSIDWKASVNFVGNLAEGATELIQGVEQWSSASLEYNRKVGMLKTNVDVSGADWEAVKQQYIEIAALTGDAEGAVEGLSNLLQAGLNDSKMLDEMADLLSGAALKWPDTLNFAALADSLQETMSTQEAAGQFAELLERMGVDLEDFNTGLATTQGETADLEYIMSILANGGLKETRDKYEQINGDILAASEAQEKLNHEWETLGGHVATWFTPVKTEVAETLELINKAIEESWSLGTLLGLGEEKIGRVTTEKGTEIKKIKIEPVLPEDVTVPITIETPTPEEYQNAWEQAMKQYGITQDDQEIEMPVDVETEEALKNLSGALEDYEKTANAYGAAIGKEIGSGIADGLAEAEGKIARQMATINKMLNGGAGAGGQAEGTNPAANLVANMQLDGKTFARVMLPYIDRAQGKQWKVSLSG